MISYLTKYSYIVYIYVCVYTKNIKIKEKTNIKLNRLNTNTK